MSKRDLEDKENQNDDPPVKRVNLSPALQHYRPSREWTNACNSVIANLNLILVKFVGPKWRVMPQGSFVQGLQLVGSDLDLVLLDGTERWKTMNKGRNANELDSAVRKILNGQFGGSLVRISVIQKIYHARVPLVRLRATVQSIQIEIDMCFGDPSRGLCDQYINRTVTKAIDCELFVLALKIWATRRKICETRHGGLSCFALVLLGIYHFKTVGADFDSFFAFLPSLRSRTRDTVSLEKLSFQRRPPQGRYDFIHVSVPCRPVENAARCVQLAVWIRKIIPEIKRARNIIYRLPADKRNEFDAIVNALVGNSSGEKNFLPEETVVVPNNTYINADSTTSNDDDNTIDEEDDKEIDVVTDVVDLDTFAPPSSESSFEDTQHFIGFMQVMGSDEAVGGQQAADQDEGPIVLHDCTECDYFAFNKSDLETHYYAIHDFPAKFTGEEQKEVNKFKIANKFKNQQGYQVVNQRNDRMSLPDVRNYK